jgi:hypothetical protein
LILREMAVLASIPPRVVTASSRIAPTRRQVAEYKVSHY